MRTLLPVTWHLEVLQAERETARRCDVELRHQDSGPERFVTISRLGFEVDEEATRG